MAAVLQVLFLGRTFPSKVGQNVFDLISAKRLKAFSLFFILHFLFLHQEDAIRKIKGVMLLLGVCVCVCV